MSHARVTATNRPTYCVCCADVCDICEASGFTFPTGYYSNWYRDSRGNCNRFAFIFDIIEASKENCDRECHELDWPLICRFKIVLETQKVQK